MHTKMLSDKHGGEKLTKTNHKDVTYRGVAFSSVKKG